MSAIVQHLALAGPPRPLQKLQVGRPRTSPNPARGQIACSRPHLGLEQIETDRNVDADRTRGQMDQNERLGLSKTHHPRSLSHSKRRIDLQI